MPHAVLQRVYHLSVRETQQLTPRVNDRDVRPRQDINHWGVLDANHSSTHHDERAGDTIDPTPQELYLWRENKLINLCYECYKRSLGTQRYNLPIDYLVLKAVNVGNSMATCALAKFLDTNFLLARVQAKSTKTKIGM